MTSDSLFSLYEGTWLFWTEHHTGQDSRGYAILSRAQRNFDPGPIHKGWESMNEESRDIYRAWCEREGEKCTYDSIEYLLKDTQYARGESDLSDYFLDQYGDETPEESGLINYERSDFVNNDMPYIRNLVKFFDDNEDALDQGIDDACEMYGYTSLMQLIEGQTIESITDFKTAVVNVVMSFLGSQMLSTVQEFSGNG